MLTLSSLLFFLSKEIPTVGITRQKAMYVFLMFVKRQTGFRKVGWAIKPCLAVAETMLVPGSWSQWGIINYWSSFLSLVHIFKTALTSFWGCTAALDPSLYALLSPFRHSCQICRVAGRFALPGGPSLSSYTRSLVNLLYA